MGKWSMGTERGPAGVMTWTHYPDAPWFDTEVEAQEWMRDWLAKQPEAIQKESGMFTIRQHASA
jgi:hypothetical protein